MKFETKYISTKHFGAKWNLKQNKIIFIEENQRWQGQRLGAEKVPNLNINQLDSVLLTHMWVPIPQYTASFLLANRLIKILDDWW